MLQGHSKWQKTTPNLKLGQVVLLVEESPRDQWRMGVVDAIEGGGDHVCSVTVRLASGRLLVRHSCKLVALEIED